MPLDAETIRRLTEKKAPANKPSTGGEKKRTRRGYMGIRLKTHYPKLIKNDFVKHVPGTETSSTMGCTSFGCGAPSYYLFLDQPLCEIHILFALVIELQSRANGTSGDSTSTAAGSPDPRQLNGDSPLVTATASFNESGEDDDDSYL
jgi:hypothetical protein